MSDRNYAQRRHAWSAAAGVLADLQHWADNIPITAEDTARFEELYPYRPPVDILLNLRVDAPGGAAPFAVAYATLRRAVVSGADVEALGRRATETDMWSVLGDMHKEHRVAFETRCTEAWRRHQEFASLMHEDLNR